MAINSINCIPLYPSTLCPRSRLHPRAKRRRKRRHLKRKMEEEGASMKKKQQTSNLHISRALFKWSNFQKTFMEPTWTTPNWITNPENTATLSIVLITKPVTDLCVNNVINSGNKAKKRIKNHSWHTHPHRERDRIAFLPRQRWDESRDRGRDAGSRLD